METPEPFKYLKQKQNLKKKDFLKRWIFFCPFKTTVIKIISYKSHHPIKTPLINIRNGKLEHKALVKAKKGIVGC